MSKWQSRLTGVLVGAVAVAVIVVAILFIVTSLLPKHELRIGSGVFQARIANDQASREKGLSGVEKLKANDALIMDFETDGAWGIWMKDMKVPLDILWLDSNKKVVYIVKNAQPSDGDKITYVPTTPARYVIELPSGAVHQHNIQVGATADFQIPSKGVE